MKKLYKPINLERCLQKGILAASVIGAAFVSGNLKAQTSYCASSPSGSYGSDIWNVSIGTLNNTSNCSSVAGPGSTSGSQGCQYSNYTSPTVPAFNLVTGVNYGFSVTAGNCSNYQEQGYLGVWIDFNQNGSFTDPGENIYLNSSQVFWNATGTVLSPFGGLTMPAASGTTVIGGTTRMRVILSASYQAPTPCMTSYPYYDGETEDYSVNVIVAPVCNQAPPANSAVMVPTSSLCSSSTVFLTNSPSYTTSGLTYTWQTSATNSVGPWTNISGANSPTYATSFSANTWVRLAAQCPGNGGITGSIPSNILIAATTTSLVPYYEGFDEPQILNDQAPNCSWGGSDPIQVGYGNTADYGQIGPNNGTGMAFFGYQAAQYGNGNTTYGIYSNGIQFNAGVTYSAAVYYAGYDYQNFTISYNSAQSMTGAVPVASVANVSSQNYKLLSGTFQVPTSGIYYIVMTASTPYPYEYVTMDDLSVTAPCTFTNNAANTTLASTNSVCIGKSAILTASGANSYTWSTGAVANSVTVTPINGTSYTVTGTKNISGCNLSQSVFVNVDPVPAMQIIASQNAVCAGQTATLIGLSGGTALSYTWTTGDSGPTAVTTTVNPTSTTTYSLIGINLYGCLGYASQVITVNTPPTIVVTGNQNICIGEPGTLSASGAVSYNWSSASSFLQANPISPYPTVNTSYTVTGIDASGCPGIGYASLTVNACTGIKTNSGTISNLNVYPNPSNGVFTVELNNGLTKNIEVTDVSGRVILVNTSENDQITVNISNLSNGIYYVKVKSDNAVEVLKVVKQ